MWMARETLVSVSVVLDIQETGVADEATLHHWNWIDSLCILCCLCWGTELRKLNIVKS